MQKRMTTAIRAELADAIRPRYISALGKEKRRILDEFIAATGYHEKSAIRALNSSTAPRHRTRRRSPIYDDAVRGALIVLWEALRQLSTLQRRVRTWRQQAVQRLIDEVTSNILGEASGNKIT